MHALALIGDGECHVVHIIYSAIKNCVDDTGLFS
jgi:hypothetical protein